MGTDCSPRVLHYPSGSLFFFLVNGVQLEIEKLKAENDRLKLESQSSRTGSQVSISSSPPPQASGTGSGLPQHSLNLTTSESTSLGETAGVWPDPRDLVCEGKTEFVSLLLSGQTCCLKTLVAREG